MSRTRNELLRYWLERARWSNKELARRVQDLAAAGGHKNIQPTGTNVRHWLNGAQPRPPTHLLIATAFTRHIGYPVSLADLGIDRRGTPSVLTHVELPWYSRSTVEATAECVRADLMLNRREAVHDIAGIAVGTVLLEPLQGWLSAVPDDARAQVNGHHLGMHDVTRIEKATEIFRGLDNQHGGGLHREAVLGQLLKTNDLLAHATYTAPVGRRLRIATAELCGLAAWMSFDSGQHRFAQRYWILGVHHAHDAGDRELAAYLLYEMSRQMMHLNRPEDALELAQMAWYGARNSRSPHLRALLSHAEARVQAELGRPQETRLALGRAEEEFATTADEPVPDRLAFVNEATIIGGHGYALQALAVHQTGAARRALLTQSLDATQSRLADLSDRYTRTRLLNLVDVVEAYELAGEYDEATTVAGQVADAIGSVNSVRLVDLVRAVRDRLDPEPTDPRVRALAVQLDRATPPAQLG